MPLKKVTKRRNRRTRDLVQPGRIEHIVEIGLLALVVLLPLMLGTTTTRPWPMFAARLVITGLFTAYVVQLLFADVRLKTTGLFIVLLGGALFTLFQLMPLPQSLLASLSPEADRIFRISLESLGLYGQGQWRPLSLDPVETWLGVSGFFTLLMVYLLGGNLLAHDERMMRFLKTLAVMGFLLAMIGFVQKSLGLDKVFGLIPFAQEPPFFFASFVNPNNLAGFLGMCVPLQIGFALKSVNRQQRLVFLVLAIITSVGVFLSLSRGGIIAFIAGQALLAILMWRRKTDRRKIVWVQAAVLAVLLLSAWLALHEITHEFAVLEDEAGSAVSAKPTLWEDTADLAHRYALTGIGAESFKVAYPIYKTTRHDRLFVYPENIVLQTLAESGLVVGGLVVLSIALAFILILRRRHLKRIEMATVCALFVIAIHNYVDFNLSTFAIAVPFMAMLGMLTLRITEREPSRWFKARALPTGLLIVFTLVAVVTALVGEATWIRYRLPRDQARLHAAVYDATTPQAAFDERLQATLKRHPADFYLHLLASQRYPSGSYSALPLKLQHLRKAGELNPSDPLVDRYLGRALAQMDNRDSATNAYRTALQKTEAHIPLADLWSDMLRVGLRPEELIQTVTDNRERCVELARFLVQHNAYAPARRLLADHTDKDGNDREIEFLIGKIDLDNGELQRAEQVADRLIRHFPKQHEGYQLRAEIFFRRAEYEQALIWYKRAERYKPINLGAWFYEARALIRLGRLDEAEDLSLRIYGVAWKHPSNRTNAFILSAEIDEARGRFTDARREYEQALVYEPQNSGIHRRIAATFEAQENVKQALMHYQRAWNLGDRHPDLKRKIQTLTESQATVENKEATP